MSQVQLFSSGLELASLVVSTDLLQVSRVANLDLLKEINQNEPPKKKQKNEPPSSPASVKFKVTEQANCTIIAFGTWPACTRDHLQGGGGGELVSLSTCPVFQFLCTKTNPSFSINKAAFDLFYSNQTELSEIKNQLFDNSNPKQIIFNKSKPLLITGHSLGGSVASLFTLWLLEKIDLAKAKRPLCITFGSPLIGDDGLRKAILKYWNSCFLHVVSNQDQIPRILISPHNPPDSKYKPFGTYLLCSELGCACIEESESILELLMETNSEGAGNQNPNQGSQFRVYEETVEDLNFKVIRRDTTKLDEGIRLPLPAASIYTQLVAIGRLRTQEQHGENIDSLIKWIEKQERKLVMEKRLVFDPAKKLNDIKKNMAQMEWYKKDCKKNGGYYDSYKDKSSKADQHVEKFKKDLTIYWENLVNEVKSKPQKEGAAFRTRWLFAGTNYRRMIEPLDIAEYYCDKGGKDYITEGRSEHYKQLEEWLDEEKKPAQPSIISKKQNVESILTEDSCFWAHVEEALISCKLLNSGDSSPQKKDSSIDNLKKFEAYVLPLIKDYAVSPEIFLPDSSFMQWWKEYKEIMGTSYTSPFTELMNTGKYKQYDSGDL